MKDILRLPEVLLHFRVVLGFLRTYQDMHRHMDPRLARPLLDMELLQVLLPDMDLLLGPLRQVLVLDTDLLLDPLRQVLVLLDTVTL
jgi:hypothetical protein